MARGLHPGYASQLHGVYYCLSAQRLVRYLYWLSGCFSLILGQGLNSA